MLRWRLLFGVLFIAALVLWCWLDANVTRPGAFLLPLALMLSWLSTEELLAMLNKRGRYPLPWVVYTGVLLTVLLSGLPIAWPEVVDLTADRRAGLGDDWIDERVDLRAHRRTIALWRSVAFDA